MFNNVVSIIACTSKNSVIGIDGKIPWYYPKDLIFFKNVTSGYPVIMGKRYDRIFVIKYENEYFYKKFKYFFKKKNTI